MMQMTGSHRRSLAVAFAGLILGAAVGILLPVPGSLEGYADVSVFTEGTSRAIAETDMERIERKYKCDLTSSQGMPKCLLRFNESHGSVDKDVKCRVMQDAMSTGRGSYVKTGNYVLDEGRIRTNPDNLEQCDVLPTDTLMYPEGGQIPVCSEANPNLFSRQLGHDSVVSVEEAEEEGRCRITFKTTSKPDIQAYASYIASRAREADLMAARIQMAEAAKGSTSLGSVLMR